MIEKLVPFIPELLNMAVMGACLFVLYKLEILYMKEIARRQANPKQRARSRTGDTIVVVEPGIIKTILRDRFAQMGVLLIAVPDIPVLVKLFAGG